MTRIGRSKAPFGVVALAGLFSLVMGCAGAPKPAQEPLIADPPLNGATGIDSGVASTEIQRGLAYVRNEKFEEAKEHFEKALAAQPDNVEAAFYTGLTRERTGDALGAEEGYKKALAIDPKFAEAAQNLSALYLDPPERADEAIAVLTPAIAASPDDAQLLQNLAYAHSLKGDVERASKAYEAAIAKADSASLRLAYGSLLFQAKQPGPAAVQLEKALALTGDDAPTLATIGRMLGPVKAYAACVTAFNRAIKLSPDAELLVRRGTCRHELQDEPGAKGDYEAAIKLDATYAPAHYYLALSLLTEKKRQLAIKELEKAVSLAGDAPIGKQAAEKLASVKSKAK